MEGQTVSHYRILEKIGEGGMGQVYLAEDTSLERKVALKFLPPALQADPVAHKRFIREAKSAAAIEHPFICNIKEVARTVDGQDFIVMEYVEGQTLTSHFEGLDELSRKMLAKSPDDRYQNVGEVKTALAQLQIAVVSPGQVTGAKKLLWGLVLVIAAVTLGLTISTLWQWFVRVEQVKSIAVLPLKNLTGDPDQDFLVEGMHEALIMELSKISALRVISRTSTMRFRDTDEGLPKIAGLLGVTALVEGSVFRSEEMVGIRAQLVALEPERNLWADSLQRRLGDVLVLQSEVARAIARNIEVAVTPEEENRLIATRPVDPECYTAYVRGRYYFNKKTLEDANTALGYFQQAIDLDPAYAPAYVGLSDTLRFSAIMGSPTSYLSKAELSEEWERCRAAAQKALELDPKLSEAHTALALMFCRQDGNWDEAETHFRRAIELDPSSSSSHRAFSWFLDRLVRLEESLQEAKLALELDPLSPRAMDRLGKAYYRARQYEESIQTLEKALEFYPKNPSLLSSLGYSYVINGQPEEARAAWQKRHEILGTKLAEIYRESGLEAGVRTYLEMAKDPSQALPGAGVSPGNLAMLHAMLGEKEEAFAYLQERMERGEQALLIDPFFDILRDDPRFEEILRQQHLPDDMIDRILASHQRNQ